MWMETGTWVLVLGAATAGFVQGLSGFAFGMVAMSFWAWVVPPQQAAVLAVLGAFTGQLVAAASVRRAWRWGLLWPFLAGGLAGVPLGVWLLPALNAQAFKAGLGLLLALWCPAMLLSKHLPRVTWGGRWGDGLAGLAGGVMGGLGGFTGVLPTLWCTLRGMPRDDQRAVIQNFNLSMLAVTLASYTASGLITPPMWPLVAVVLPAMLLPSWLGARLYLGISDERFRQIVLGLLTASGVALLSASLPRLWAHG